jgi:hypothetical protein
MNTNSLASLAQLSNDDLLAQTKRLVQCEREATTQLIAHLAEIETRRLHRREGCSSLFAYCTERLHLSESAAYRRILAARLARRFPIVLEMLAQGSVTLTTVRLLAAHLTPENHRDLLDAARHRSRLQVEELVARLHPRPPVPDAIRKLPRRSGAVAWPPPPGSPVRVSGPAATEPGGGPPAESQRPELVLPVAGPSDSARRPLVTPLAPETYKIQFTIGAPTLAKLRRVQNLMRHRIPNGDLAQVFDAALTQLLGQLEKQKFGRAGRPRPGGRPSGTRHISAALRREVHARDGERCTFVSPDGHRCSAEGFLEFEHREPHGVGGPTTAPNLTVLCRAHNQYRAEQYYGRANPPAQPRKGGSSSAEPGGSSGRDLDGGASVHDGAGGGGDGNAGLRDAAAVYGRRASPRLRAARARPPCPRAPAAPRLGAARRAGCGSACA